MQGDRQIAMVLSFDGICVLCNGFVRFLAARDRQGRLRFASSESPAGSAIFIADGQDPNHPVTVVLVDGERRYVESEAIIRSVAALGGAWRLAAIVRVVPGFLRDAIYRLIARNRYRWFGRLDRCPLPGANLVDRFMT